ncbi:hypothetical protein VNO77_33764 [Canavalia gladiata]|uniref:Uncharacterized protein n=1 Tax=Canavalia gladiata TaxID=3824 RepID=A0AAN9PYN3_CANGL
MNPPFKFPLRVHIVNSPRILSTKGTTAEILFTRHGFALSLPATGNRRSRAPPPSILPPHKSFSTIAPPRGFKFRFAPSKPNLAFPVITKSEALRFR